MLFPEDSWKIVKEFMLVPIDGILFEKICSIEPYSLELQYHVFYRLLQTKRTDILGKMMMFVYHANTTLMKLELYTSYLDTHYDASDDFWECWENSIKRNQESCLKCIQLIREMDHFMNIYETAHIKTLMEIVYNVRKFQGCREDEFIKSQFRVLLDCRRQTPAGMIKYIWEIKDLNDINKIEDLCCNVLHIEKKGRHFVIACSSNFESFKGQYSSSLREARKIGVFTEYFDDSCEPFKRMLDLLEIPLMNYINFPIIDI